MKKVLAIILAAMLLFTLSACNTSGSESLYEEDVLPDEDTVEEEIDLNWGLELSVDNISTTSLTLSIEQSGVEINGELWTGSPYWIELYKDGEWKSIEETPSEYERAWTMEAYIIPLNGKTEMDVNIEWLYGELPAGHYRIGKDISVSYAAGNRDSQILYAEFDIQ